MKTHTSKISQHELNFEGLWRNETTDILILPQVCRASVVVNIFLSISVEICGPAEASVHSRFVHEDECSHIVLQSSYD